VNRSQYVSSVTEPLGDLLISGPVASRDLHRDTGYAERIDHSLQEYQSRRWSQLRNGWLIFGKILYQG
jgi:hypothetical protein